MLAFVAEIVSQFPVTRDLTHVGLVKFSTNALVEFGLDEHYSNAAINRTIYDIRHTSGETNIAEGLRLMREQVFTQAGDRRNVKNIAIVITDGVANEAAERVGVEARRARDEQKIEIFTIGITNQIDEFELELIASQPYSQHKFLTPNFQTLRDIVAEVKKRACDATSPTASPTPSISTPWPTQRPWSTQRPWTTQRPWSTQRPWTTQRLVNPKTY